MEGGGLRDVFITEAREILNNLESELVILEEQGDAAGIHRIFRYVHTLKGGSGMAGFTSVYEFTHRLESLLDLIRSETLSVREELIDLLLGSLDWIADAISCEDDDTQKQMELGAIRDTLMGKITMYMKAGGEAPAPPPAPAAVAAPTVPEKEVGYRYFRIWASFRETIFESGIDPLMIMEDLFGLGKIIERKVERERLPNLSNLDPQKCYIGWNVILETKLSREKIDDVFLFVRDDNDIIIDEITANYVADEKYTEEKRIGEILVGTGILTKNELDDVLINQEGKNRRVGDIVVERGYATEKEVQFALGEQEKIRKKIETNTVRVDTVKLDRLLNLLGEIVIGQSSINRIADELDEEKGFRLKNALYGLDRTTREFQEQIMSIRMVPIGSTFEKFRRFVRDASRALGKDIRLEIAGGETELDKTVIEQIDDPLKHMIRNAIDHGLETPEERNAAGKDPVGSLKLTAYHQEGNIYIEVIDDGRGIDRVKIREKLESMGLVRPGEEINDVRLLSFLLMPGFSTAEKVGDLSGRGVGMDVVKTNIESLRGSVEIQSKPDMGTVFRIKLPLTLAIIEGMLVRVGSNVYIVPLLSIVESMKPVAQDIKTVKEKGEVVLVRNEYISLVRLYKMFGITPDFVNPWDSLVVIVESSNSRIGIMIDELMGQQQIVIKSLDNYISKSRAISGAAILGDGRVSLIIDVHGLIEEIAR